MKRLLLLSVILISLSLYAGKPKQVDYTYTYLSNDRNESQALAEQHAIERAKQKVLEETFGIDVSSIVVSLDTETQRNSKFSTSSDFFSLGGTSVRGEWIISKDERVLSSIHNGDYWEIKVFVSGTIREKTGTPIDLHYAIISQPKDRETRPRFFDGEDLLFRFSSPVNGALCVYLVDESKTAYCLLPYMSGGNGYAPIKANEEYLFFSKETDENADELVITTEKDIEFNVLYVIFSPNNFTKARDKASGINGREQLLPRSLPYEEFLRWLARNQTSDEQMQVRTELIEIRK